MCKRVILPVPSWRERGQGGVQQLNATGRAGSETPGTSTRPPSRAYGHSSGSCRDGGRLSIHVPGVGPSSRRPPPKANRSGGSTCIRISFSRQSRVGSMSFWVTASPSRGPARTSSRTRPTSQPSGGWKRVLGRPRQRWRLSEWAFSNRRDGIPSSCGTHPGSWPF